VQGGVRPAHGAAMQLGPRSAFGQARANHPSGGRRGPQVGRYMRKLIAMGGRGGGGLAGAEGEGVTIVWTASPINLNRDKLMGK